MPRLSGVDIPNEKPIKVSLTYIYGIGRKRAEKLLKEINLDPNIRANKLTSPQLQAISARIDQFPTEGDLKKIIRDNIQRLKRISAYRGLRHIAGLPARGQRTRTNARSLKGRRKTVGSMTKEMRQKLETPAK